MNLVPDKLSRGIHRQLLKGQKNSPHILFFGGVIGLAAAGVLACRATLNLEKHLDEMKADLEAVKMYGADSKAKGTDYHKREYPRDLGYVYAKSTLRLAKLYGPPIVVGTASVALLTGSHVQMTRRNAALTMTLAAVSEAYEKYRYRVQETLGESKELEVYRDLTDKEVEEDGKKKLVRVPGPNGGSPYARVFDQHNINFVHSNEYNRIFIEIQQKYANDKLLRDGHVFLNEVYDSLGIPHSQAGAVVGWVIGGDGDNHIDFGMYEGPNQVHLLGVGQIFYLDFNVDGIIYNLIEE